jgi:hypothetical protein
MVLESIPRWRSRNGRPAQPAAVHACPGLPATSETPVGLEWVDNRQQCSEGADQQGRNLVHRCNGIGRLDNAVKRAKPNTWTTAADDES